MPSRVLYILACFVLVGFLPERSIGPKAFVSQHVVATVRPGQPDAETLGGYWEAKGPFARGSAQVGILIKISAHRTVPRLPNSGFVAGPQQFTEFDVGFYERTSPTAVRIGWLAVAPDGGASWDGHRLRIKFNDIGPGVFIPSKLRLDVAFNHANHTWAGTYTRNRESKSIALRRPAASIPDASTRFVGAWREVRPVRFASSCIYMAQGADGAVVAWRDSRSRPIGDLRQGWSMTIWQTDGDALGIHIDGDTLTLQEDLYSGGVAGGNYLPRKFFGKLSPDGSQIIGSWTEDDSMPLLPAQPPPVDSAILVKSTTQACLRSY